MLNEFNIIVEVGFHSVFAIDTIKQILFLFSCIDFVDFVQMSGYSQYDFFLL